MMRVYQGFPLNEQRLERELDQRWRSWLWLCLGAAATAGVSLAALVGPHQTVTRIRYEVAQLSENVDKLERECRRLQVEREVLTSPKLLTEQTAALGLVRVPQEKVAFLDPDGHLFTADGPPPPSLHAEEQK
jgi:hypothetical protein